MGRRGGEKMEETLCLPALGMEPGNEAGEWSLGMRLGNGAWE